MEVELMMYTYTYTQICYSRLRRLANFCCFNRVNSKLASTERMKMSFAVVARSLRVVQLIKQYPKLKKNALISMKKI